MIQSTPKTTHCINPECPRPYPLPWGHNFCQSCGSPLRLHNRYIPLQRLGMGGFAAIYTVWDGITGKEKVLKVLLEPSPKALELFQQEAWVLSNLRHWGVPRVDPDDYFQVMIQSPQTSRRLLPCLIMEKIEGKTLESLLDEYPQGCPENWVYSWLRQAIDILEVLHQRQIIHRDIKPSNLMLKTFPSSPGETSVPTLNIGNSPITPISQGILGRSQLVMIDFGGAKQVGYGEGKSTSTRLISPGYSPPEQITGKMVGVTVDFYALGRTCIHLLTGKYPGDLEDPITGQVRWRHLVSVSPRLANLLDDMVQLRVTDRPQSAAEIRQRLRHNYLAQNSSNWLLLGLTVSLKLVWFIVGTIFRIVERMTWICWRITSQFITGILDTSWSIFLAGIGGMVGALGGLVLAYWSGLGVDLAGVFSEILRELIPSLGTQAKIISQGVTPAVILFSFSGLAIAVGITDGGGFAQSRYYLSAGLMGMLGYGLAGLFWSEVFLNQSLDSMIFLGAISVASMTLGLGLPSHRGVYALTVAMGTVIFLGILYNTGWFPEGLSEVLSVRKNQPNWDQFWMSTLFFAGLGSVNAFSLGVSHYVIVPVLRWLGW